MYTQFGKFLRILRLDNGDLLKDMADKLEVSSAFLSAVETGKKSIPENWYEKIKLLYLLSDKRCAELKKCISVSKTSEKLKLTNNSPQNVQVALQFARRFNERTISDKTMKEILKLLNRDREE